MDNYQIFLPGVYYVDVRSSGNRLVENSHRKLQYECDLCGEKFLIGNTMRKDSPKLCNKHELFLKCSVCEKMFKLPRWISWWPNGVKENECICGKECSKRMLKMPGYCTKCGNWSENRNHYGYCEQCSNQFNSGQKESFEAKMMKGKCVCCGKIALQRDVIGRCKSCHDDWYLKHNSSQKMKKIQSGQGKRLTEQRQLAGECLRCGQYVPKRNSAGVCSSCMSQQALENKKMGVCSSCGALVEKRDTVGRCLECRSLSLNEWLISGEFKKVLSENGKKVSQNNQLPGKCCLCGKWSDKRNPFALCYDCMSGNFDYVSFCESFDHSIEIDTGEIIDNFDSIQENSGVWALWGKNISNGNVECLTVGQTVDIKKELKWTVRVLNNENLLSLEKENPGCTGRWSDIQSLYKEYLYVKLTDKELDFEMRENI